MKYLAIDTSGKRLAVVAVNEERTVVRDLDCAMRHSVVLLPEIDGALKEACLTLRACDFIACVVGPGSFTGIRIGIAAVKGLCMAAEKKALALTSFEAIAYADMRNTNTPPTACGGASPSEGGAKRRRLALVDAGHDFYYACAFEGDNAVIAPAYLSRKRVEELIGEGYAPLSAEPLGVETRVVSLGRGLLAAANAKHAAAAPMQELAALYLRKSSAEERR